ncbi:hypothetical protein Cni_G07597 [Canna indica]|uniref:BolA protein n=1 Tax=Canna indica TaxID=4628 RepID=A0AAQ3K4A9_9LILI|nr:hypothetical protein Cni_G07597 [Canna indica]
MISPHAAANLFNCRVEKETFLNTLYRRLAFIAIRRHPCSAARTFRGRTIRMMGTRGANIVLSRANRIRQKLQSTLEASVLEIDDVSHKHAGHAGVQPGAQETHFNIKIVSPKFDGQSLVKRHQMVYQLIDDELKSGLHAVSIVAKTPQESGSANA